MNTEKIIEYLENSDLCFKFKLIKFIKLYSSRVDNLCVRSVAGDNEERQMIDKLIKYLEAEGYEIMYSSIFD